MKNAKAKKAGRGSWLYLYYLDCCLHLVREKAGSNEARLLLKTHPDFAVGFYTYDADKEMIHEDAAFTRDMHLKKRAA